MMIAHTALGTGPTERRRKLHSLIRRQQIGWGGYKKLKIYGRLSCSSGKQMNITNRVFFGTEQEAIAAGYRPCGHCMPAAYQRWKNEIKRC
jgi:methylphosphotriester-DNA--protein-cysteine methyltransferase